MKKRMTGTFLICISLLLSFCLSGCSDNNGSADSNNSAAESSDLGNLFKSVSSSPESSDSSPENKTDESNDLNVSKEESSVPQESSISEEQQKTEQAKKDIKLLVEYKEKIPQVSEQTVSLRYWEGDMINDIQGKIYYVDSVIRDVNNDGKMELIVKYDCTFNNGFGYRSCYLYDLVSVVDGKAVAAEHYKNEAWYEQTVN